MIRPTYAHDSVVDLRSDTVTRPSEAMRDTIARAPVGDDVYREDPSVAQLEEEVAAMVGFEDAVFTPSGTMANQIAIMAQTQSGDELWTHEASHVVQAEQGAPAVLGRVLVRTFAASQGVLRPADLEPWVKDASDPHNPSPRMIWLENTIGCTGGGVLSLQAQQRLVEFAQEHNMIVHLDGSRLWNAAVALSRPPSDLTTGTTSVSVCFSKGLGAPVGSAFLGSTDIVERARRARKLLGGGMRQSGMMAAGALYALRNNLDRLADDHARARLLARGLVGLSVLRVDPQNIATNMVLADVLGVRPVDVARALYREGVLVDVFGPTTLRLVTHLDIDDADIERATHAIAKVDESLSSELRI